MGTILSQPSIQSVIMLCNRKWLCNYSMFFFSCLLHDSSVGRCLAVGGPFSFELFHRFVLFWGVSRVCGQCVQEESVRPTLLYSWMLFQGLVCLLCNACICINAWLYIKELFQKLVAVSLGLPKTLVDVQHLFTSPHMLLQQKVNCQSFLVLICQKTFWANTNVFLLLRSVFLGFFS